MNKKQEESKNLNIIKADLEQCEGVLHEAVKQIFLNLKEIQAFELKLM